MIILVYPGDSKSMTVAYKRHRREGGKVIIEVEIRLITATNQRSRTPRATRS